MIGVLLAALVAGAPQQVIDGVWKGTSLCQVKPSPCHDETVVYRVKESGPESHRMAAYKIVAGKEDWMGDLVGYFTGPDTFKATSEDRQHRVSTWTFTITGDHMSGRLTLDDGTLYRLVEVDRAAQ